MDDTSAAKVREEGSSFLYPRLRVARFAIIAGLTIAYLGAFRNILQTLGDIGLALVTVPVVLTGWYFGTNAGFVSSLIGILLNAFLFWLHFGGDWNAGFIYGWPVDFILVFAGYGAGVVKQKADEQARASSELRARERYLTLISIATQDLLTPVRLETRYYNVINHLVNLLTADFGQLILWNASQGQALLVASTSWNIETPEILDPKDTETISHVLQSGRALVVEDIANSNQAHQAVRFPREDAQPPASMLYLPLMTKENKLGVITLAFLTPHQFTEKEIYFAELACKQMALALRNILQDIEIQKRLQEERALAEISRALSETERGGLDEVLHLIVNSAKELIPAAEQAVIHLLDLEHQCLIPRAVTGFYEPQDGKLNMRLGMGVAGQGIADGIVVNIGDVSRDSRFIQMENAPRFRSLLVSPVQSGKGRLGTISVQSSQPQAFNEDEQQLLTSLGIQAAIAIENAHLLEDTQQSLQEINTLYRITQDLVATFDTQALMKEVVDILQKSFGYYQVQILISDINTGEMVVQNGSGNAGDQLKGLRLPAGAGIIGHAVATGEPFFTNDVDKVVFYFAHPLLPETQSELAVPIKINNRVVGVLDIQQAPPRRLTERDMQLVSTVAEQLAVSLQKANLYADLQNSLQHEKATRQRLIQSERLAVVGRLLASVSHELNNPLQAIQNALFLLREEHGISAQGKQDLAIVLSETERMAALIERLRSSYRPASASDFQSIQLNALLEDVHALVATHLRHNHIAFEFHPDPNLPPVIGLPDQFKQVTLNLVMNAVEAMPGGGRLTITTAYDGEKEICFSIADTGPGMDPTILPNIFDPFVTNKRQGTGLGLTITYDIIQRHHGRIVAENAPGGGAIFTVWLPIHTENEA